MNKRYFQHPGLILCIATPGICGIVVLEIYGLSSSAYQLKETDVVVLISQLLIFGALFRLLMRVRQIVVDDRGLFIEDALFRRLPLSKSDIVEIRSGLLSYYTMVTKSRNYILIGTATDLLRNLNSDFQAWTKKGPDYEKMITSEIKSLIPDNDKN
jgi:hypothetical protein